MAQDGDINLRVRAVGLQRDITQQARNAERVLQRRPLSVGLDPKGFTQPLGRITGNMTEFQKSLDASTARVFAFGATTAVLNGVTQSFKKLIYARTTCSLLQMFIGTLYFHKKHN